MRARVEVFPVEEWPAAVAARFDDRVRAGSRVCLAAGSTPTPLYGEIAREADLDNVTIFLLDEFGGLPRDDPGRCESMLRRDLLSKSASTPTLHTPDVDAIDPEQAAERYATLITGGGLDLALVGLGANGHIGMNEPGTTIDQTTRVVRLAPSTADHAAVYGTTTRPTWGITVGMAELMAATEVWVLVTGSHKAEIVGRAVQDVVDPEVPASHLTRHPNCTFYVDEAAAVRLSG